MSDLTSVEERVMLTLKRGEHELRFRFVRAKKPDGAGVAWHDLRHFERGSDGQMHPTQKGVSIRTSELRPLLEALTRATGGGTASAAPAQRELLPHEVYDRRAGRDPR